MQNTPTEDLDLAFVDQAVADIGTGQEKVLEMLQAVQGHYGYLPQQALERVCDLTEITPAAISGVSSFYSQFRHRPIGRHIIHVCVGTACHVKGASQVYDAFRRYLGLEDGEDTDPERNFTVEKIACLGCCTLAPAVQIGSVTYGHVTPDSVGGVLDDYVKYRQSEGTGHKKHHADEVPAEEGCEVRLGLGSCCIARGSGQLHEALQQAMEETGINVPVKRVGCVGMCHQTPLLEVVLPNRKSFLYARVRPEDAKAIMLRHFEPKQVGLRIRSRISRALDKVLSDSAQKPVTRYAIDVREQPVADFLDRQVHIATEHCGDIDPVDFDEYVRKDGFKALKKCLKTDQAEIVDQITQSGLRGRGGAGFPTGRKWAAVSASQSDKKYLVCNGDEGDPGAFMDRMLMESYPLRILEGMIIAARAVGASEGFLYIRAEYPLALKRIQEAIDTCMERNLLGDRIMGSDFSFTLKITAGAGAFVCGEETALMQSIQGRRGMPVLRPPYPAEKGLWGKPTLINNAETYALVPWIIRQGADAFAELGTDLSKGTKVFALAGKINRGGLIEVPMGISIHDIVEQIGGGVSGGLKFKAVQIGGPSGGCIPAEMAGASVDYESLTALGAMMGSGGMVVLDETDCMVEIARYFLEFTQDQSCGRCTPCRIGTRRMLDILERLCKGEGTKADIERLEHLAHMVKDSSLCGLGTTAPNPILSTLKYFREEYEAHIEKRCPAGKCKALIAYSITDDCIGCTLCAQGCPSDAIEFLPYEKHEIDQKECVRCGACKTICPVDAVKVQ